MKAGDLVRWKKTGKVCIYLGTKDNMHRFYSDEYGIVEKWIASRSWSEVSQWIEVVTK